ncbi:MAG: hypothetical protein KBG33_09275 [Paludibacteraceae bacterium]|nr:hypothetical protein [Paludibacteraceae bacterium]
MRKLLVNIGMAIVTILAIVNFVACEKYNDDDLWDKVNELDNRINILEDKVNNFNTDILSLKDLYKALDKRLYITKVENITNGTRITFSDGTTTTITNGTNGKDGTNGLTPVISAALYNGVYYWTQTINGETSWITDANGNKIPTTGADAVTPLLKISDDGYWMISYNKGDSYSYITDLNNNNVKAVGTNGKNGEDGDSFFESVEIKNSQLVITLLDGTIIMLPLDNATVVKSHAKVDMGLSVKWATMNVGADAPHEVGSYSLWGDGTGTRDWDIFDQSYSKDKSSYNITATSRDLAHMKWGNGWRTPTYNEFSELIRNTSRSVVVINGVKCLKFTSNINGNQIVLPANGGLYTNGWSSSTGFKTAYTGEGTDCYYMTSTASDLSSQPEYLYAYFFYYSTSNQTWNFSLYMIGFLKVGVRPVIS